MSLSGAFVMHNSALKTVNLWSTARSIFTAASRRRQKRVRGIESAAAVLESLENRALLASAGMTFSAAVDAGADAEMSREEVCEFAPEPGFEVDGNVVRVSGTHGDDVITAFTTANGLLTVVVNDVTFAVSDSQVDRLEIDAKCGNDFVGVRESVQHLTVVSLGNGDDTAYVLGGPTRVSGDAGNDLIVTGDYDDKIGGGAGHDILLGGIGNDVILGGAGNDGIAGGDGNDTVRGNEGADILLGDGPNSWPVPVPASEVSVISYLTRLGNQGFGHDSVDGGSDDDQIYSGQGNDLVFAGSGNDFVNSASGNDVVIGGDGDDAIASGDGNDWVFGDGTNALPDVLPTAEELIAYVLRFADVNSGNDVIAAGNGHDIVFSGRGADRVYGGQGNDIILAGAGNDWVEAGAGRDIIHGGADGDVLFGGAGTDVVFGAAGDDYLIGGSEDDQLHGGAGNDWIFG
ncbi:MAG: hypothetical protein KDA89_22590, partial [Planctomycetaceae bacterium]|nr:hypothetical protein [Planctomycetaceae bacterium]